MSVAFKYFMKDVDMYPLLTDDESLKLFEKFKNGDEKAFEMLVNCNLRLVVYAAKQYLNKTDHLDIMDIIQEGTIGLMKAVKGYKPEVGKFSTYAVTAIKRSIQRSIDNQDNEIRRSVHYETCKRKYYSLVANSLSKGESVPSDEDICRILNVSMSFLTLIKESNSFDTVSLNKKVDDSSNSTELEYFWAKDLDNNYSDIEKEIDTNILLAVLKKMLTPIQYFIIYYHVLYKSSIALDDFGEMFNVSRERIRQIQDETLDFIKPYMNGDNTYIENIIKLYRDRGIEISQIRTEPVKPNDVIKYFYIKNNLSVLEKRLFYFQLFGEVRYSRQRASKELGCTIKDIEVLECSLKQKIKNKFSDLNKFSNYAKNMLEIYGTSIYTLMLGDCVKEDSQSNNTIITTFHKSSSSRLIVKDVYLAIFGFKSQLNVPKAKLYKIFKQNADKFDNEESLFLECLVFNKKSKHLFKVKYPDSNLYSNHKYLFLKLEILFYGIKDLFYNSFNKEKYLFVKSNYLDMISERRIKLLDLYYGVFSEPLSIIEIAEQLNENYSCIRREIYSAIEYLKNIYSHNSREVHINKNLYKSYVIDKRYELTGETRLVLKCFLFDNLDYGDIANKLGLPRSKISNLVNDGLRKIDYYRFGLLNIDDVDEQMLGEFFVFAQSEFTIDEKRIIMANKCELKTNREICEKFSISQDKLIRIIVKFNNAFLEYRVRDVKVSEYDVLKEINRGNYDSVISLEEKQILSLYFGFKNEYNIEGAKLNKTDIAKLLKKDLGTIADKINRALNNIKARSILLIKPELLYLDRNVIDKVLDDNHLPIDSDKKNIICYLLGLKDYPCKTLKELASMYNTNAKSIKRQYQRAIIIICKYMNHEIEGKLDYDEDILPFLKYFSKRDVTFITESFKEGLTNKEIAKKYNVKLDYVSKRLMELKNIIFGLLKGDIAERFNFEIYRELVNSPDLPFYGNLELTKKCFELYIGESTYEHKSIPDIIQMLNLSCSEETVRRYIELLMLSIYKLQNGVKKHVTFTIDEIRSFYLNHKNEMNNHKKELYLRTIESQKSDFLGSEDDLSDEIIFDLLKEQYPDVFDLSTASSEEIIKILKKYDKLLDDNTKEILKKLFNIDEQELACGKELKRAKVLVESL